MMFGRKLKGQDETRCVANMFEVYSTGICRLGKKIGCRKISHFHQNLKNFSTSYLFTKSVNPCRTISKRINKAPNHLPPISFKKRRYFFKNPIFPQFFECTRLFQTPTTHSMHQMLKHNPSIKMEFWLLRLCMKAE